MSVDQIIPKTIDDEMKESYIDYAMSVIVSRALPDVRDGLKPVHRRILYAMHNANLTYDKPFRKSATIVGDVLGKYHPHGDASVYDALVRMAQDFNLRYPLVQGHGNFGSIDGDPPAAYRYTEARMAAIAMEMLEDIDKDTVDFRDNFDNTLQEPVVLPSRFPNLIVDGSSGIAVGMATNIPPHNLGEIIDATVRIIDDPSVDDEELIDIVKAPDFPTGALIMGVEGARSAYRTGKGIVIMRARIEVEERKGGRQTLIVKEIPYQINKARLIEQLAEQIRAKKISHVSDLRDESDRSGMRIVLDLGANANVQLVQNQLFKHSNLQCSFGIILLALVDGVPKTLTLAEILKNYLAHRLDVVTRRCHYELRKAKARAHIVEGLRIALDHIDEVIALIRSSREHKEAKERLMERFGLTEPQAQAILEMRLQRLTGLERNKLEEEYAGLMNTIAYLEDLLADERKILGVIKDELLFIKEKYGDARRSEIVYARPDDFEIEDLIPEEEVVITISHSGYIKRLPVDTYKSQHRGGRGILGLTLKEEDFLEHVFVTSTHHFLLFITNRGRMYRLKVYEINEASRQSKGTALVNLLPIEQGERVSSVVPVREFNDQHYILMATKKALVKKTNLIEYVHCRRNGLNATLLQEDDELIGARLVEKSQEIFLVTEKGICVRFESNEVRIVGRVAKGVKGMRLRPDDSVVAMVDCVNGSNLLVVTTRGHGKQTDVSQYRKTKRGAKGIITMNVTEKSGNIVAARMIKPDDEMIVVTREGNIIRFPGNQIPQGSRTRGGVMLIRLAPQDFVTSMAVLN
ncbi:MAG: DNA gyrase subunit A [Vulcanimicrobiota bacterium]